MCFCVIVRTVLTFQKSIVLILDFGTVLYCISTFRRIQFFSNLSILFRNSIFYFVLLPYNLTFVKYVISLLKKSFSRLLLIGTVLNFSLFVRFSYNPTFWCQQKNLAQAKYRNVNYTRIKYALQLSLFMTFLN